jgi:hypothetical protein
LTAPDIGVDPNDDGDVYGDGGGGDADDDADADDDDCGG